MYSPQLDNCKRGTSVVEGDYLYTDIAEISKPYFDSPTTNKVHNNSSPIKDCFVYKRKKVQRSTFALLSDGNLSEVTDKNSLSDFNFSSSEHHLRLHEDRFDDIHEAMKNHSRDCEDNEKPSFSGRNHLDVHTTFKLPCFDHKNIDYVPICANIEQSFDTKLPFSAKDFKNMLCSSSTGNCNAANDAFVTSKSHVSSASILTVTSEHNDECFNSSAITKKYLEMFESTKELCIYVLRMYGLLRKGSKNSACVPLKRSESAGLVLSPCKICGLPEDVLKMLICDNCEEAFHLSCCNPKVEKLPINEWHCQFCFKKKPMHLLMKNTETISITSDDISESGGPILSMLRGSHPHRSRVRVGDDFQVEVPNWSYSATYDDDYFSEPKEMDQVDCCRREGWSCRNSSKSSSIGNWLQCKDEDDNGNICGKWRRAPLFSVQTDDWDCSCALPWDPIHADCSVPQELDTEEVLKHLKHIVMFKTRLNNRMKPA